MPVSTWPREPACVLLRRKRIENVPRQTFTIVVHPKPWKPHFPFLFLHRALRFPRVAFCLITITPMPHTVLSLPRTAVWLSPLPVLPSFQSHFYTFTTEVNLEVHTTLDGKNSAALSSWGLFLNGRFREQCLVNRGGETHAPQSMSLL